MRGFTAVDLTAQCEVRLQAHYEYELLEKIEGATDLIAQFATKIWSSPEEFQIPLKQDGNLTWRWRALAQGAGIASLRMGAEPLSLSLLASGIDASADQITLTAFQQHAMRELHDTGFEPAFDLMSLTDRPLIATINIHSPREQVDRLATALADRCFAASYFRYHGLV